VNCAGRSVSAELADKHAGGSFASADAGVEALVSWGLFHRVAQPVIAHHPHDCRREPLLRDSRRDVALRPGDGRTLAKSALKGRGIRWDETARASPSENKRPAGSVWFTLSSSRRSCVGCDSREAQKVRRSAVCARS